jgi:hypothetical protein
LGEFKESETIQNGMTSSGKRDTNLRIDPRIKINDIEQQKSDAKKDKAVKTKPVKTATPKKKG